MAVIIRPISVTGSGLVTRFTDDFNRASGGLGPNWIKGAYSHLPANDGIFWGDFAIATVTGPQQGLACLSPRTAGVEQTSFPGFALPTQLFPALYRFGSIANRGIAQFAEMTLLNRQVLSGAALSSGPIAFFSAGQDAIDAGSYYGWVVTSDGKAFLNTYKTASLPLNLFQINVANTINNGDTIRIEVTPSAANNEVRVYINGVIQATVTDADSSRPVWGVPGMMTEPSSGGSGGVLMQFDLFTGGKL
jgi:hypothetical protein